MRKMASKDSDERVMTVDELLKNFSLLDDGSKLKAFIGKYEELFKHYRNMEFCNNAAKRDLSTKIAENNKLVLARSKLESLCREIQKQNKAIKDETILRIREEEEKRKQITQEFQKTLNNVTTMMTDSNAQNTKLGEENKQMAQRLSSIYEEFKTRESEVDRITKQIDLERQLCEARCAKMKTEFIMEKQTLLVENEGLNQKIGHLTRDLIETSNSCTMLEQQVAGLTAQIEVYTGKYEEFETTISKSGRIFDHCKSEIDKLNKQIKILEKEVTDWQNRYKKNVSTIYELQLDNSEKTKVIDNITKKQNQLTKLCRQLQAERRAYINSLRDLGQNPSDIVVDTADDDSAVDEPQAGKSAQASAAINDDTKLMSEDKASLKNKRGKQKRKKGKDFASELQTPPMTLKEIQLAELKEELNRVQKHVMQIQSLEAQCNYGTEVAKTIDNKTEDESILKDNTSQAQKIQEDNAQDSRTDPLKSNEIISDDSCPNATIIEEGSEKVNEVSSQSEIKDAEPENISVTSSSMDVIESEAAILECKPTVATGEQSEIKDVEPEKISVDKKWLSMDVIENEVVTLECEPSVATREQTKIKYAEPENISVTSSSMDAIESEAATLECKPTVATGEQSEIKNVEPEKIRLDKICLCMNVIENEVVTLECEPSVATREQSEINDVEPEKISVDETCSSMDVIKNESVVVIGEQVSERRNDEETEVCLVENRIDREIVTQKD